MSLVKHDIQLVLNSVGHMGMGTVVQQDDAFNVLSRCSQMNTMEWGSAQTS
jgi:hypothetical protein